MQIAIWLLLLSDNAEFVTPRSSTLLITVACLSKPRLDCMPCSNVSIAILAITSYRVLFLLSSTRHSSPRPKITVWHFDVERRFRVNGSYQAQPVGPLSGLWTEKYSCRVLGSGIELGAATCCGSLNEGLALMFIIVIHQYITPLGYLPSPLIQGSC